MLKRYYITLGAKTTAGGSVISASAKAFINGTPRALEGDLVHCPACGSDGIIQVVQPRLHDRYNGKQFALADDLCVCKCNPPPKLIAIQQIAWQTLSETAVESAVEAQARAASADMSELVPLRFVDEATGKPHANRPYRIELKGQRILTGTTDASGCTKPLAHEERDALVACSLNPDAP